MKQPLAGYQLGIILQELGLLPKECADIENHDSSRRSGANALYREFT